jgi:alkylation response protein AidB-like acyl-CoA dehydrogenase
MTVPWDRIERLADEAADRAEEIEDAGELPADLLTDVVRGGLLRLGLPARWGGHDASPSEWFRAVLRIATGDGSTGWLVGAATSFHDIIAAGADPALQERFFADRLAFLAGGVNGDGVARAVAGGFEVSGRWSFASGCRRAPWLGGLCVVDGGAAPAAAPVFRWVMVPAERADVCRTWDALGLRGTGSDSVVLPRQVVPTEWTFPFPYPLDHPATAAPPYAAAARGLWPTAFALAATQLGMARRALDEVVAFARTKHRPATPAPLIEEQVFVRRVATAEAAWRTAVRAAESVLDDVRRQGRTGAALPSSTRVEARLIATHGAQLGASIVRTCFDLAGAGAIGRSHPLARCLRDGTLLAHHGAANEHTLDLLGRVHLGLAEDSPLV